MNSLDHMLYLWIALSGASLVAAAFVARALARDGMPHPALCQTRVAEAGSIYHPPGR